MKQNKQLSNKLTVSHDDHSVCAETSLKKAFQCEIPSFYKDEYTVNPVISLLFLSLYTVAWNRSTDAAWRVQETQTTTYRYATRLRRAVQSRRSRRRASQRICVTHCRFHQLTLVPLDSAAAALARKRKYSSPTVPQWRLVD